MQHAASISRQSAAPLTLPLLPLPGGDVGHIIVAIDKRIVQRPRLLWERTDIARFARRSEKGKLVRSLPPPSEARELLPCCSLMPVHTPFYGMIGRSKEECKQGKLTCACPRPSSSFSRLSISACCAGVALSPLSAYRRAARSQLGRYGRLAAQGERSNHRLAIAWVSPVVELSVNFVMRVSHFRPRQMQGGPP